MGSLTYFVFHMVSAFYYIINVYFNETTKFILSNLEFIKTRKFWNTLTLYLHVLDKIWSLSFPIF